MAKDNFDAAYWIEKIQQDTGVLQFAPEELRSGAVYLAAVEQDGRMLYLVPESFRSEAVCLAAVRQNSYVLEFVPEPLRTEAVCLAAVQQYGWTLKHVPESLRTEAMCFAAVKRSGSALEYVPKALQTVAMCITAMQENSWAFEHIPKNLITQVKGQTKYGTFFDEQRIKEILIAIRDTNTNFEVLIKDERLQTKRGSYYPSHNRITLYLFEYNSNNDLIRCAIHEYAHHILRKCKVKHQTEFWICYFELLAEAEKKEFYSCNIDKSGKLKKITNIINQNDLLKNKTIFKEGFGDIFFIINKLCEEIDIDFQYYSVKYLEMDWYKEKNPYLAFNNFHNYYFFGKRGKELDDLLDDFFKVYSVV
jgi:hypothetical protein